MATIYYANGNKRNYLPTCEHCGNNVNQLSLNEAQDIVDGYVAQVPVQNLDTFAEWHGIKDITSLDKFGVNAVMLVNEEGILHNMPYNHNASILANQPIVGDAIVTTTGSNACEWK